MHRRRSKGPDIIKRFTFFFPCFLCSLFLISCKIFLIWLLLIDREPNVKLSVLLILKNEKKIHFAWIYFRESFYLTFRVDLILRIDYRWIFREDLFSWILVLSMFYIFWFFLGLFFSQQYVCKSRNSYSVFLIFQIVLFGYKRLNSWLNA